MCVSDPFIPLFAIPYRIIQNFVGVEWFSGDLGSIICKLVPFTMDLITAVSILSMLAMAVERFRAVVQPTKSTLFTISRCRRLIALIWLLSAATHSIYFYTFSTQETRTKTYCTNRWYRDDEHHLGARKIYGTYLIVFLVVTPMVLITVLYTAVVVSLHRQKTQMASHLSSEPLRRRAKQNRKITFMFITVVALFAVSFISFGVWLFLAMYSPHSLKKLCSYHFVSLSGLCPQCCKLYHILYV